MPCNMNIKIIFNIFDHYELIENIDYVIIWYMIHQFKNIFVSYCSVVLLISSLQF